MVVVAVGHQTLRGPIPPGRNVLGERLLVVESFAGTVVRQFDLVARNQHIFRFDVAMKNSLLVAEGDGFEEAVHVVFDLHGTESAVVHQSLIKVLLHELEDECQLASGLVVQDFDQLYDVVVGGQVLQSLDFG